MGTDIHGGFIKYDPKTQTTEPVKTNWGQERDYLLFAVLADVRNGRGFAGSYRHEPIKPIAAGRGLPEWVSISRDDYSDQFYNVCDDGPERGTWLGDHSHTYMTVKEILDWDGWDIYLNQGGFVKLDHYKETLANGGSPEFWCGGVGGEDITKITEQDFNADPLITPEEGKEIYVAARWVSTESIKEMLAKFHAEVVRIAEEHGNDTFLVIGFDS